MYTVQTLPVVNPASSSLSADGQTLVLSENSEIYEYRNHDGTFVLDQILKGSGNVVTSGGTISTSQGELFSSVTEKILYSNIIKADTVSALNFVGEGTSQWTTDSTGIDYVSNVGIGGPSNTSSKLFVSGVQTREPVDASYYLLRNIPNSHYSVVSGSGNVAAYVTDGTLFVTRSENTWIPEDQQQSASSVFSISYDGNKILYQYGDSIFTLENGSSTLVSDLVPFTARPTMSSDGMYIAFSDGSNVIITSDYTHFSNITVNSAYSLAFATAAHQIAILNGEGIYIYNAPLWTNNNSTIPLNIHSPESSMSISGDGTVVVYYDAGNSLSNVLRYNGKSEWISELTTNNGPALISEDGKVVVTEPNYVYYNTSLSTWTHILSLTGSANHSISSTGRVISQYSNIYSITLPDPGYFQNGIQVNSGFSVSSNGLVNASAIQSEGFSVQSVVSDMYTAVTVPASRGTAVSSDGQWAAFGNYISKTVRVYHDNVQFGNTITSNDTYFGAFVSLNRDGTVLAIGGHYGAISIYTRTQTDWIQSRYITTGTQTMYKPCLSGDGTRVVLGSYFTSSAGDPAAESGGGNGTVYAYNTVSGNLDWSIQYYENERSQISTAISDDGKTVVVAIPLFYFMYVYEYGTTTPVDMIYQQDMFPDPSVSTNGKTIVLMSYNQNILVYNRLG